MLLSISLLFALSVPHTLNCADSDPVNAATIFLTNGYGWKQMKRMPEELDNEDELMLVWRHGIHVRIEDQVEGDISENSDFCFDSSGKLTRFEHEVWTVWGWSTSETGDYAGGNLIKRTVKYFKNGKQVNHLPDANGFAQVEHPTIYLTTSQLPVTLD